MERENVSNNFFLGKREEKKNKTISIITKLKFSTNVT